MKCARCKKKGLTMKDFNASHQSWCTLCLRSYYHERKPPLKPKKINALRNVTDFELIQLITENTLEQIAVKLSVSKTDISKETTRRGLFNPNKYGRRKVKREPIVRPYETTSEDDLHSVGAWSRSKERKSFINAGLMVNKSLKYN